MSGRTEAKKRNPDQLITLDNGSVIPLAMILNGAAEIKPRGREVMLPHGGLPEILPDYLKEQISRERIESVDGRPGPFELQFLADPEEEHKHFEGEVSDPLREAKFTVAPGLVLKYPALFNEKGRMVRHGRALWTVTYNCAAFCRHCTRGHEVGIPKGFVKTPDAKPHVPFLTPAEIDETLAYIREACLKKIMSEVIISGGDPLTLNLGYLRKVIEGLMDIKREGILDIIRLGTRMLIQDPRRFTEELLDVLGEVDILHLMVQVNHETELSDEVLEVWHKLRAGGAIIRTQTVLLRGVNDDPETLYNLFYKIAAEGGVPYYVYQNDPVYWAQHFTVPIEEAIEMWQNLRRTGSSGLVTQAKFVIDAPGDKNRDGFGKIVVPEGGAWPIDVKKGYVDAHGQIFPLDPGDEVIA